MTEKNSIEELNHLSQEQINWTQNRDTDLFRSYSGKQYSLEEWNALNHPYVEQFRASNGMFVEGMFKNEPILLLTTIGARSGLARANLVMYTRDGDNYVVLASKLGAPNHPAWYHNLIANPIVTVEVGSECFQAKASVVLGTERDRLFNIHVALMPNFADYQRQAGERIIPVILLERSF